MQPPHVRPDFDLQSHSVHSDGALSAADVVAHAAAAGLRTMSLTDHDTVDGVGEALRRRARTRPALRARRPSCRPSRASSRTCTSAATSCATTIRCCWTRSPTSAPTAAGASGRWPTGSRSSASSSTARTCARARPPASRSGRPHLADAVLAHPANAARLREEGIAGKNELFPPYLVPGAIAYVARSRPTVEEAIEVIHAAGGLAVWAHPFWDIDHRETVLAASTASPRRGSTASRSSTRRTTRRRRRCSTRRARRRAC